MCQGLSVPDGNQHKVKWEHLKNIPFPKAPRMKTIDILIGSDHPELALALAECYSPIGAPVARKTPLGWTCVGRYRHFLQQKGLPTPGPFGSRPCTRPVFDEQLRGMWEIDSLGVRRQLVESGGDLSYVKGRKVKTMDRGALRSSHSVEGRLPLHT